MTDGSYTTYGYDDDAQLNSSLGYDSGGFAVAAEQLGFGYDAGWNMTSRSVNGTPTAYTVDDLNEVTANGSTPCGYDANGNRNSSGQGSGTTVYTYDDENRLNRITYGTVYRSDFVYDGLGRMRIRQEYTYGTVENEVAKSGMAVSGSGSGFGWDYVNAKNGLITDPGWHNTSYSSTNEYLRVDLGSSHTISHVAYEPRVMASQIPDGSWNGVYKQYAVYVTDDSSGNPNNWGTPVATGTWTWPNLQERKDLTFTAKSGRYVYFRRISAYGWYTEQGYPGYASANEIWVYEQTTGWNLASETRYIYDGKRVIQERDVNNRPAAAYTRGLDLSSSLEGAGGIGGLLARSHGYSGGSWSTHNFYHGDAVGNVTYMISAAQAMVASYKYDPYGRTITSSGSMVSADLYRFSSKEFHVNSGLYYYLYRFYDPGTQRWPNRDALGELGFEAIRRYKGRAGSDGPNFYTFVHNDSVSRIDGLGLKIWVCTVRTSGPPLYGVGRHAYFWDDRPGTAKNKRECGKEGSSGSGGHSSDNVGPTSGESSNPWNGSGPKGDTTCYPVDGSDGKEQAVMDCCDKNANKGMFWPGRNDCHNTVDDCLKDNGLKSPPHPRLNHPDDDWLYSEPWLGFP